MQVVSTMCVCKQYYTIEHTIYHDEDGNPTLSVACKIYCDHMGSHTQIISDIPLEVTAKEWEEMSIEMRVKVLKSIPNIAKLGDIIINELAKNRYYLVSVDPCPYCSTDP